MYMKIPLPVNHRFSIVTVDFLIVHVYIIPHPFSAKGFTLLSLLIGSPRYVNDGGSYFFLTEAKTEWLQIMRFHFSVVG